MQSQAMLAQRVAQLANRLRIAIAEVLRRAENLHCRKIPPPRSPQESPNRADG